MHPDDSHLGSPDKLLVIFICTISGNNFEYQGDLQMVCGALNKHQCYG